MTDRFLPYRDRLLTHTKNHVLPALSDGYKKLDPRLKTRRVAIISCVGVLALASWFVGRHPYAGDINAVLIADNEVARTSKTFAEISTRMRDISLAQCPQDFALAYLDHIHAWEEAAAVEWKAKQYVKEKSDWSALIEAIICGLNFDFSPYTRARDELQQITAEYDVAGTKVRTTYQAAERIAVSYGATPVKRTIPAQ